MKSLLWFVFFILAVMVVALVLMHHLEMNYLLRVIILFIIPIVCIILKSFYNGSLHPVKQLYNVSLDSSEKFLLCEVGQTINTYPGSYTSVHLQKIDLTSGLKVAEAKGTDFLGFFERMEKGCLRGEGNEGYWLESEGKTGIHVRDKNTLNIKLDETQLLNKIRSKFPKLGVIKKIKLEQGVIKLEDNIGTLLRLHPETLQEIADKEAGVTPINCMDTETSIDSFFFKSFTYELIGDKYKTLNSSEGKSGKNRVRLINQRAFSDGFFLRDLRTKGEVLLTHHSSPLFFIVYNSRDSKKPYTLLDCVNRDGNIKWSLGEKEMRVKNEEVYGGYILPEALLVCHERGLAAFNYETRKVLWKKSL